MGHGFLGIPNHIEPDLLLRAFEPGGFERFAEKSFVKNRRAHDILDIHDSKTPPKSGFPDVPVLAMGERFLRKHDQNHMFVRGKKQTAGNGMK